jgi:hypothetical protein
MKKFILSFLLLLLPGVTYAVTLDAYFKYSETSFKSAIAEDYSKLSVGEGKIEITGLWRFDAMANYASNKILKEIGFAEKPDEKENNLFLSIFGTEFDFRLIGNVDSYWGVGFKYKYLKFDETCKDFSSNSYWGTDNFSLYVDLDGKVKILENGEELEFKNKYQTYTFSTGWWNNIGFLGVNFRKRNYNTYLNAVIECDDASLRGNFETEVEEYQMTLYVKIGYIPEESGWGFSASAENTLAGYHKAQTAYFDAIGWTSPLLGYTRHELSLLYKIGYTIFEIGGSYEGILLDLFPEKGEEEDLQADTDFKIKRDLVLVDEGALEEGTGYLAKKGAEGKIGSGFPIYHMFEIYFKASIHF